MPNDQQPNPLGPPTRAQNIFAVALVLLFVGIVGTGGWYLRSHRGSAPSISGVTQGKGGKGALPTLQMDGVTVHFAGELRRPTSELQIEFKNAQGQLMDVGKVKFALDMNMPGMVMHDDGVVSGSRGRYTAKLKPQMAGDWTAKISYSGPQGSAEKTFPVTVKGGG